MIKANELRIGNWLTFYNLIEPKKYFEVDGRFLFNLTKFDAITQYYQPIPLTPEILEAAGFESTGSKWYRIKYPTLQDVCGVAVNLISGSCSIESVDNEGEGGYIKYEMRHVHQLQNLYFALTVQELTINLHATA